MAKILVTWVAKNNDPYEADVKGIVKCDLSNTPQDGPTLSLLFDSCSPIRDDVSDVILLCRKFEQAEQTDAKVYQALKNEIKLRNKAIQVHSLEWCSCDPTDHEKLFDFLRDAIQDLLKKKGLLDKEIVVHISPGTPAMHAVMLLMVECGYWGKNVVALKSYRKGEKADAERFKKVDLGVKDYFNQYLLSRPAEVVLEPIDVKRYRSPAMQRLYQQASNYALLHEPVLICGEMGTDKYSLATFIRLNSTCKNEANNLAWPRFNCAIVQSRELLASKLCGTNEENLVLRNETVLLDNIELLDGAAQELLAALVAEQTFRVLVTTDLDLPELQARLAPRLFAVLNGLSLRVPPLREVKEELPLYWEQSVKAVLLPASCQERQKNSLLEWLLRRWSDVICSQLSAHALLANTHDLQNIAKRLIAGLLAAKSTAPTEEDVCKLLKQAISPLQESTTISTAFAKAFLTQSPLDEILKLQKPLQTDQILKEMKKFIAEGLQYYASETREDLAELSDVSDRTLRDWRKTS